jgi:hypothetical protein
MTNDTHLPSTNELTAAVATVNATSYRSGSAQPPRQLRPLTNGRTARPALTHPVTSSRRTSALALTNPLARLDADTESLWRWPRHFVIAKQTLPCSLSA